MHKYLEHRYPEYNGFVEVTCKSQPLIPQVIYLLYLEYLDILRFFTSAITLETMRYYDKRKYSKNFNEYFFLWYNFVFELRMGVLKFEVLSLSIPL